MANQHGPSSNLLKMVAGNYEVAFLLGDGVSGRGGRKQRVGSDRFVAS